MNDKDFEWAYSRGGRIFSDIGRNLELQTKVEASRGVESGISGPHCHKYLPHRTESLIHPALLNDISMGNKNP